MKRFVLTEEHRKLLKAMCVSWNADEFGAPSIDPKRPYGNSDVLEDMCEILGITDVVVDFSMLDRLHRETMTALEILLQVAMVIPGAYVAEDDYDRRWALEVDPRV